MRVVAEQSEIRPSFTSLTSFTSNIDLEEIYASYANTTNTNDEKQDAKQRENYDTQLPPSYDDLLK